jgi:hypothetical protein
MNSPKARAKPYFEGIINELRYRGWLWAGVGPKARKTVNRFFQGERVRIWLDRKLLKQLQSLEPKDPLIRDEAIRQTYEEIGAVVGNQIALEKRLHELGYDTPEILHWLIGTACFSVDAGQVNAKSAERWITGIKRSTTTGA